MLFNRIYNEQDLERYKREREERFKEWEEKFKSSGVPEGLISAFAKQVSETVVSLPAISGLEVVHTGVHAEQNFSTSMITELIKTGIAQLDGDELIIQAAPEHLHYTIKRFPGRYCLHCSEKLPDDANGELARLHIAMKHNGVPSPDESIPSGYEWLTGFECVLDEEQHESYKFVKGV